MKRSVKSKYHVLLIILFIMIVVESVLLLYAIDRSNDIVSFRGDVQSIIIVFLFLIFVYMIVIYNYIPFKYHKAIREVQNLVDEISEGKYNMEIDPTLYELDSEIQEMLLSLQKMLMIILRFDHLKADKIYEHHQRLQQLINLLPQGVIILSSYADVIYCNEVFRKVFTQITENVNLKELIFKNVIQVEIIDCIIDSLRNGKNLANQKFIDKKTGLTLGLSGSLVRDRKGNSAGGVYVISINQNKLEDSEQQSVIQ